MKCLVRDLSEMHHCPPAKSVDNRATQFDWSHSCCLPCISPFAWWFEFSRRPSWINQSLRFFFLPASTLNCSVSAGQTLNGWCPFVSERDGAAQHGGRSADGAGPLLTSLTRFPAHENSSSSPPQLHVWGPWSAFQVGAATPPPSKNGGSFFLSSMEARASSPTDCPCEALSPNAILSGVSAVNHTWLFSLNAQQERRGWKQTNKQKAKGKCQCVWRVRVILLQ